jgi:hypothetical protein
MRWKEEICGRGLSGAPGYFVFEVVEELNDESLIVIAVRQLRGCSITLAYGLVGKDSNRWLLCREKAGPRAPDSAWRRQPGQH